MNGWWKFHRKMLDHAVWFLPGSHFKVWISILNLVNHKDADWWDGVSRVTIPAGSFVTSQDKLADYSKTSRQAVRAAIVSLTKIGSISTKIATKRYTHIFVTNWSVYSGEESQPNQESNQRPTQDQPSANQAPTITGEGKKERRKRKNILLANPDGFAAFWSRYPKKLGKAKAEEAWNRIAPQNGLVEAIISSILAHMKTPQWSDPQFIPYPATFLNGRRWEDVLVTVQAQPQKRDPKEIWKTIERYQEARRFGRVKPGEIPEWEPTAIPTS